jgi:hypothetical protein
LLVCAAAAQDSEYDRKALKVSFESLSDDGMSVIFSGNFKLNGQNYTPWNGRGSLLGYLNQGKEITHWASFDDRFVLLTQQLRHGSIDTMNCCGNYSPQDAARRSRGAR